MAPALVYGDPPPRFFGVVPLLLAMRWICFVHFLSCVFVISTTSSVVAFNLGTFEVTTQLQNISSCWSSLGISVIVGALIGVKNRQAYPLTVYLWYCLVTLLGVAVFAWWVISSGSICRGLTNEKTAQRVGRDLDCDVAKGIWSYGLATSFTIVSVIAWSVWELRDYLLQHEAAQDHLGREDPLVKSMRLSAGQIDPGKHDSFESCDPCEHGRGGQTADWGSVHVNSTRVK
eukprot:TRINITY_DN21879_c0_g1_i1.p1 TRINITY_DN21879_c0_g1~~TRINITY_DN21879_c0_g1_i1.p1  ORF type:complete len:264 (+),score=6.25 TRINITY_DN21879_c0_g1_i1:100-792(+)